jgi:hypothetical protein
MTYDTRAFCGLDCDTCDAYVATQKNDKQLLAQVVEKWSSPEYPITAKEALCDGCKSTTGRRFKFCKDCEMRACGLERGVATCAHCEDYGCNKMEGFFEKAGDQLRDQLEEIRGSL